jgi:hypothetical protein
VKGIRPGAGRQNHLTPRVLPNSGANEEVSIRNSRGASTETRLLVPPRALNAWAGPVPD